MGYERGRLGIDPGKGENPEDSTSRPHESGLRRRREDRHSEERKYSRYRKELVNHKTDRSALSVSGGNADHGVE